MAAMGVHVVLLLPNMTACKAEMDQLLEKFKPVCSKQRVRSSNRRKMIHAQDEAKRGLKMTRMDDDISSANGDIGDDDKDVGGNEKLKKKEKKGQSVCIVSFSNYYLGNLIKGWPNNPIRDHPFDCHTSKESIIKSHIAMVFMPMMGRAAKDPKVRFEFGPGGAPPDEAARMEHLREEYQEAVEAVNQLGYNGEMLDVEPNEVEEVDIPLDKEAQI